MKLQIKTLSPIHIGNGEKYNGLSYVEDISSNPKRIFIIDFERIKRILDPKDLQYFMEWVVSEGYPSWSNFCEYKLNKPQLLNEFKKKAIYTLYNYSAVMHLEDIECFIKQNNKPYIPGTEIKGAIRTAVAYYLLNKGDSYKYLKDKILEFQNRFENTFFVLASCQKKAYQFLELKELKSIPEIELKGIFGENKGTEFYRKIQNGVNPKIKINAIKSTLVKEAGKIEKKLQNIIFRANGKDDAKYDLLKMLYIGDTDLKEPSQSLFISDVKTLNISRQFSIFQEFCKKDLIFTCHDFNLNYNKDIVEKLGFNDEQKWVISDIKNLFQCCYEFSKRLIDEELAYKSYPKNVINKLRTIKEQNTPQSPVIRIGKNEGYLSVTIGLVVKDKDKNLYDNVLCHATKNTSYTGNFPKTRRIVSLGNNDVDTMGWVKLTVID